MVSGRWSLFQTFPEEVSTTPDWRVQKIGSGDEPLGVEGAVRDLTMTFSAEEWLISTPVKEPRL